MCDHVSVSLVVNVCCLKLSYVRLSMQYMSVLPYVFVSLCCSCVCLFVNSRTFLMLHRQPTRDSMLL